jgi:hypothetical protein
MAELIKHLIARVEEDHKKKFSRFAKKRGLTESELLRELVLIAIGESDDVLPFVEEPAAELVELERVTVRLPKFLIKSLQNRAKSKGMAQSRWISALVQSNVTGQPVMTDKDLVVLNASNRELAAIGRNINQIAKSLNRDFYDTEQVRLAKLEELSLAIAKTRDAIRALVKASQNAWESN